MADEVVDVGGSAVPRKQAGKASDIFSSCLGFFFYGFLLLGWMGKERMIL